MERLTSAGFLVARPPWQASARPQAEQSAVADPTDTVQLVNPFFADLQMSPTAAASPVAPPPPPAAETSRTSILMRASVAGLAVLSLFGGPMTQAVAAQAPPSLSVSVPAPAPQQALSKIDSLLAHPAKTATLPAPNAASRARLDRVESNVRLDDMARSVGVPAPLLKAVAWQESTWMHTREDGSVVTRANLDSRGHVLSHDVGIMQVNSRAHAGAFPKARTYDGNLQYGARLLKSMVDRFGTDGVWHYNGDADYQRAIERHLEIQPWTVEVWKDQGSALRAEQNMLERTMDQKGKLVTTLESRVAAAEKNALRDQKAVTTAREARAQAQAERVATTSAKSLTEARTRLEAARLDVAGSRARLDALPGLIDGATAQAHVELDRVMAAQESYIARTRAQQMAGARGLVGRLAGEKQQSAALLTRLEQLAKQPGAPAVKPLMAQAKALRDRAGSGEVAWKAVEAKLAQGKEIDLSSNARALKRSDDRVKADSQARADLAARVDQLTARPAVGAR